MIYKKKTAADLPSDFLFSISVLYTEVSRELDE